jgi:hypothetical protein
MEAPPANRSRQIAADFAKATTPAAREQQARLFLREIGRATKRDMPTVRAAIADLRTRVGVVEALVAIYRALRAAFDQRLFTVRVKELQLPGAPPTF